jgi:outer membrane protein
MPCNWWRSAALTLYLGALCSVVHADDSTAPTAVAPVAPVAPVVSEIGASMTLEQALAYARAHQPAIRAALARIAAQRAAAQVPRAQWLPLVAAGAELLGATANNTTASYVSIAGIDIPRIGATRATSSGSFAPYASTLATLGAQQEIFDFGRIAAQSAVEDALVELEQHGADADWLAIALAVEESYFAVRAAHAIKSASEQAYERARVHRDLAAAKVAAGLFPPINLTRADADLTRFDVGRIEAAGGLATAQSAFGAAVGAPERMLDASGEPPPARDLPSLAEAVARAQAREPMRLQAAARLKTQQAVTHAVETSLRPNLALSADISAREGGAAPSSGSAGRYGGWIPDVPNWDAGFVLRVPLYDAVVSARSDASRAQEQVRSAELELARERDVAAVQQAYVAVKMATAALDALERALDAAQRNYEQADARFRGGLGTVVELADAEALRVDADIQLALGHFKLARARALLGRTMAEGL